MNLISALMGQPDQRRLILARLNAAASTAARQRELYNLLYAYWANQGLYKWLAQNRYEAGINAPAMQGIRTPCARIVDFYVSHLWPGNLDEAFPLETDYENITEPIKQLWLWSNWESEKDLAAQWLSLYGDLFIRVAQPEDRRQVYFELIQPQYVTDFTEERGFVKSIRLDIPITDTSGGLDRTLTHTEVWNKADQSYRRWRHEGGQDAAYDTLGTPEEEVSFAELGIDFVPFVHARFKSVGDQWGMGAFTHLLDKVDELNLKATRHSEIMFNHLGVTWSLESDVMDGAGRSLPPLTIDPETDGVVTIGGGRFFRPPSGGHLKEMVPNIQYEAYLNTIESEER
ncbi:MAG TPA: hypothetical protein VNM48_09590, partial [Chloroflexota bacterium]|nr:hypothetical protein [Chloroflexota bacterium]